MPIDLAAQESEYRVANGGQCVNLATLMHRLRDLGYRLDRSLDCDGPSRYVAGPRAGFSFPVRSLYPVQISDGLSAWNVGARRDENYRAFQRLRDELHVLRNGRIWEL